MGSRQVVFQAGSALAALLALMLLIPAASAIGISPASKEIGFGPERTETVDFTVFSNTPDGIVLKIDVRGGMKDHLALSTDTLEFEPGQRTAGFRARIKMPASMPEESETAIILAGKANGKTASVRSVLSFLEDGGVAGAEGTAGAARTGPAQAGEEVTGNTIGRWKAAGTLGISSVSSLIGIIMLLVFSTIIISSVFVHVRHRRASAASEEKMLLRQEIDCIRQELFSSGAAQGLHDSRVS